MKHIEIPLPAGRDIVAIEEHFDSAISAAHLVITMRSTLNKFPGCIHWHLKKGKERGTLELTLWPKEERAWFSIQRNRKGDWMEEAVQTLTGDLQSTWGE